MYDVQYFTCDNKHFTVEVINIGQSVERIHICVYICVCERELCSLYVTVHRKIRHNTTLITSGNDQFTF